MNLFGQIIEIYIDGNVTTAENDTKDSLILIVYLYTQFPVHIL